MANARQEQPFTPAPRAPMEIVTRQMLGDERPVSSLIAGLLHDVSAAYDSGDDALSLRAETALNALLTAYPEEQDIIT